MEHSIGDLTSQIKQPSKPYKNLSKHAVRQATVHALHAMIPTLDVTGKYSVDYHPP